MSLLQTIKNDLLSVRKQRNEVATKILSTLYGEASIIGKNNNRETTDDEVKAVIRKFIKNIDETINLTSTDTSGLLQEKQLLSSYIPQLLAESVLLQEITLIIQTGESNVGKIIKLLNSKFPEQINNALVPKLINSIKI